MSGTKPSERCCATCACHHVIEPPRIATDSRGAAPANAKPVWVCRLNPPYAVTYQQGGQTMQGLVQQATTADTVCWQWRPLGTEPGENHQVKSYLEDMMPMLQRAGLMPTPDPSAN